MDLDGRYFFCSSEKKRKKAAFLRDINLKSGRVCGRSRPELYTKGTTCIVSKLVSPETFKVLPKQTIWLVSFHRVIGWLVRLFSMWSGFEKYFYFRVTKVPFLKSPLQAVSLCLAGASEDVSLASLQRNFPIIHEKILEAARACEAAAYSGRPAAVLVTSQCPSLSPHPHAWRQPTQ